MITTAADLAQLKEWFKVEDDKRDGILLHLLEAAFLWCANETGLLFAPLEIQDVYSGNGKQELIPIEQPLVSVKTLKINGEEVDPSTGYTVDGYLLLPARDPYKIVLRGCFFTRGHYNVELDFTAGKRPPETLCIVARELAANKYKRPEIQLLSSVSLGQQTISYSASDLTDTMKETLNLAHQRRV